MRRSPHSVFVLVLITGVLSAAVAAAADPVRAPLDRAAFASRADSLFERTQAVLDSLAILHAKAPSLSDRMRLADEVSRVKRETEIRFAELQIGRALGRGDEELVAELRLHLGKMVEGEPDSRAWVDPEAAARARTRIQNHLRDQEALDEEGAR